MDKSKLQYMKVDLEVLLGILKGLSRDIPEDIELVSARIEDDGYPLGVLRLYLRSATFKELPTGALVPRFEPEFRFYGY